MIYVVKVGKFVKIGYSTDVSRRFKELQSANPEPLELVGAIPGTWELERRIHTKLAPHRCLGGGEWYKLESQVTDFVTNLHGCGLLRLLGN